MTICYVAEDCSYGVASVLPAGAIEIPFQLHQMLVDNYDILAITIRDNTVHVSLRLDHYKRKMVQVMEQDVASRTREVDMDALQRSVVARASFFDKATGKLLTATKAAEVFHDLVQADVFWEHRLYQFKAKVLAAQDSEAVDRLLDAFRNTPMR